MTINKAAWTKLAEKYDSKAKWAEAILFASSEEHDELLSALIELDPKDLLKTSPSIFASGSLTSSSLPQDYVINTTYVESIDTDKLKVKDELLEQLKESLDSLNARVEETAAKADKLAKDVEKSTKTHFQVKNIDPKTVVDAINKANKLFGNDGKNR